MVPIIPTWLYMYTERNDRSKGIYGLKQQHREDEDEDEEEEVRSASIILPPQSNDQPSPCQSHTVFANCDGWGKGGACPISPCQKRHRALRRTSSTLSPAASRLFVSLENRLVRGFDTRREPCWDWSDGLNSILTRSTTCTFEALKFEASEAISWTCMGMRERV